MARWKKIVWMAGFATLAIAALATTTVCLTSGCSSLGYLAQAANGHLSLLRAARPVPEWLADSATPPSAEAAPESTTCPKAPRPVPSPSDNLPETRIPERPAAR